MTHLNMKIMVNPEFEHYEITPSTNMPYSQYKKQFYMDFLKQHCILENGIFDR